MSQGGAVKGPAVGTATCISTWDWAWEPLQFSPTQTGPSPSCVLVSLRAARASVIEDLSTRVCDLGQASLVRDATQTGLGMIIRKARVLPGRPFIFSRLLRPTPKSSLPPPNPGLAE